MALSLRNAGMYKMEQLRLMEVRDRGAAREKKIVKILTRLQEDLGMKELPVHIECFDNSNLQGSHPVSACVVFRNGFIKRIPSLCH